MKELFRKAGSVGDKLTGFIDGDLAKWLEENTTLDEEGRKRFSFYLGAFMSAFMACENKEDIDRRAHELLSDKMIGIITMSAKLSAAIMGGLTKNPFQEDDGGCDGNCDACGD